MRKLNLIKDKRGLEKTVIVTSIIVIISFIIILGAVGKLGGFLPETLDREICRNSVFAKAAVEERQGIKELFDLSPSLKCKTEYLCLHQGGKCPETGFDKKEVRDEEHLTKEIADSMFWCWWQLGEGKADFMEKPLSGIGATKSSCVICSVIKFDEFTKDKELKLIDYLGNETGPFGNKTYMDYFTDNQYAKLKPRLKASNLVTDKDYAILFVGLKGGDVKSSLDKTGIGVSSVGVFSLATGAVGINLINPKTLLTAIFSYEIFDILGFGSDIWNAHIATIRCDGEKEGCFTMMLVPYNAQEIAIACNTIESIP